MPKLTLSERWCFSGDLMSTASIALVFVLGTNELSVDKERSLNEQEREDDEEREA